jgi:hypothetical protein
MQEFPESLSGIAISELTVLSANYLANFGSRDALILGSGTLKAVLLRVSNLHI